MQEQIHSKDVRIHPRIWEAAKHLLEETVDLTLFWLGGQICPPPLVDFFK